MRIIQLHAENVKRVKAVDITPSDDCVVISGLNGAGKSSVIDSIWLALQNRAASKNNPNPLRAGTDKGVVTIDLGQYIVTRRFTEGRTTLEVRTPTGDKVSSPQKLLDGLIGDLSFDPWEFSRKKESEQRELLGDLIFTLTDGKVNLASFDARKQEAFDKRTEANREKKRLATVLTTLAPPTEQDPSEEVSIDDLTTSINQAVALNTQYTVLASRIKSQETSVANTRHEIERLRKQLELEEQTLAATQKEFDDLPELPDVEFLQNQLKDIEQHNRRAREVIEYRKTRAALSQIETHIGELNDAMELADIEKAEALEQSPLPVKGLRVTADGVQVVNPEGKVVPFCQASSAQRLRISLGIAMAANPKLRVIRIADGSLLDDESMAIIRDMAKDEDFQVWIEYASRNTDDRMGVYIEDGSVVESNVPS